MCVCVCVSASTESPSLSHCYQELNPQLVAVKSAKYPLFKFPDVPRQRQYYRFPRRRGEVRAVEGEVQYDCQMNYQSVCVHYQSVCARARRCPTPPCVSVLSLLTLLCQDTLSMFPSVWIHRIYSTVLRVHFIYAVNRRLFPQSCETVMGFVLMSCCCF